ncbi:MAG TPA: hypothetical protein VJQ44_12455 [Gemmatimonadales bacterium]|nr:hypothetical protein [Gemmatimonadales bacterium]
MELIASTTERTTAATDLVLALAAIGAVVALGRRAPSFARGVWQAALTAAAAGAALGAVAHGLALSAESRELLWQPLFLLLGVTVSLFVVGAVASWQGAGAARRLLPPMLGLAVLFYLATRLTGGDFLVFVLFQAGTLVFATIVYLRLGARGVPGAGLVAAGLAVTLAAGAVQAMEGLELRLIWAFDHNGLYHLVQLVGLGLLTWGLGRVLPRATA